MALIDGKTGRLWQCAHGRLGVDHDVVMAVGSGRYRHIDLLIIAYGCPGEFI